MGSLDASDLLGEEIARMKLEDDKSDRNRKLVFTTCYLIGLLGMSAVGFWALFETLGAMQR